MIERRGLGGVGVAVEVGGVRRDGVVVADVGAGGARHESQIVIRGAGDVIGAVGVEEQRIGPEQYEIVFERLWHHARCQPYAVKTTEAPHYRRYVLQQGGDPLAGPKDPRDAAQRRGHRAPLGVGDGRGIMFVSQIGEIYPAGFLPLCCGRFPRDSVVEVYQTHPTFRALRDPDRFQGICGACEYRHVCGGSRARAYALTDDPYAEEPDCIYVPPASADKLA